VIRQPQASGFYPSGRAELQSALKKLFEKVEGGREYSAGVVPHAGYAYSGMAAASFYKSLAKFDSVVILGNDHYGNAFDVSLHPYSHWETPLGKVPVEGELSDKLDFLGLDSVESPREHSIEVQLPFLQFLKKDFSFLPITVPQTSPGRLKELGEALATLGVPIIATSDMSHYVSKAAAQKLDNLAIEQMLKVNPSGLFHTVNANQITMCGVNPVTALLHAVKGKEAELVTYYTSGDVTGDSSSVVGYASVGFR
jgi:AmmeMemoRadiSam system protein B